MEVNAGEPADLLGLTTEIVTAHLSKNMVSTDEVPALIRSIHAALASLGQPETIEAPKQEPAVSVRSSIRHDYIICLEDGVKLKMLKRYLRTRYDLTPDEYRAKWGLPSDYPMVAPAYAAQRKDLAVKIGLGRKPEGAASLSSTTKPRAPRKVKADMEAAEA